MLTKEFRIPLPMTVEEYRIAQLYMIQKKSRLESTGSGSAVEIIENKPYENGPGGSGQYTKKIYHIGSHLPSWLKSLLPKTALCVEEEAWNAYPYTKTRHTCPFISKFFIDIETHYLPDYGQTENIFDLSKSERKNIEIDLIDPIKDNFPHKDYKKEEDPHTYCSKKTGRGPLQDDWLEKYKNGEKNEPIMCAYKLIKVEFKYWGMQSKIEQFIQNGLRNPMLVGHRQAWAWQDEWYGLTIEDIRELERQTQIELNKRMGQLNNTTDNTETAKTITTTDTANETTTSNNADVVSCVKQSNEQDCDENVEEDNDVVADDEFNANYQVEVKKPSSRSFSRSLRGSSSDYPCLSHHHEQLLEIHMQHIEQSESSEDELDAEDDDDAFFDALENLDDGTSHRGSSASLSTVGGVIHQNSTSSFMDYRKTLVLIVQGGNICDLNTDYETRLRDFQTFERIFTASCNQYYPGASSLISFEVVTCPSLSIDVMRKLKDLDVSSNEGIHPESNVNQHLSNSFPFGSVPLLITQSPNFQCTVDHVVAELNEKYKQYVSTLRDDMMNPNVYILADSVGGLLVHDALSTDQNDDLISINSDNVTTISIDSEMFTTEKFLLDFVPNGVFTFGSPVGLVLFQKKISTGKIPQSVQCGQVYNLFHPHDPMSSRLEPVLDKSFGKIKPAPVPRHQSFPYNQDIQYNYTILYEEEHDVGCHVENNGTTNNTAAGDALGRLSTTSCSENERKVSLSSRNKKSKPWWGTKRIDYMLHCPDGLEHFPVSSLLHLCYNSYWESKDLVSFILWQILDASITQSPQSPKLDLSINLLPKEKWLKKRTNLKIKNLNPNHRANDIIKLDNKENDIIGKFAYGPVDLAALSGEKIDIYMASHPRLDVWNLYGTGITDRHGRLTYKSSTKDMEPGVYSVQMVVRGDHSHVECNMAILPPQTDAVVFSIDGSFLASYSLRGIDPKIRGGAVDVVRHWQELGYLIIYVSSRLIYQKGQVMSWLSQHNFPFGMVSFCENISKDFHRHKIDFLKCLTKQEHIHIHAAYGSSRDIPVFVSELRLPPERVFLIGKKPPKAKKADLAHWITDGYAPHLNELKRLSITKRSINNKNMFFGLGNFEQLNNTSKKASAKKKLSSTSTDKSPISRTYSNSLTEHTSSHRGIEIDKKDGGLEVGKRKSFMKSIRSKSKATKESS